MKEITNPMHPHNVLSRARELIQSPEHWTQGTYAEDAEHRVVNTWEDSACHFCLIGAIRRASFEAVGGKYGPMRSMRDATMHSSTVRLIGALRRRYRMTTGALSDWSLSAWNDVSTRQHHEVLELLDDAIAKEAAS